MTTDDAAPPTPPKKRAGRPARDAGGEAGGMLGFRATKAERAAVQEAAAEAGLSVGGYVRSLVLAAPQTRPQRRPSVDLQALAKLQGELNRIGGNIHQILKRVNFGETPEGAEFTAALAGYRETIAALLALLGRAPRP